MIILGIDPGTTITGYGIIKVDAGNYEAIDYGVIVPPKTAPLEKRYATIFKSIEFLIEKHKPNLFSIETQFVHKNVQSAIKLGMARGVSVLAAALKDIEVKEFAPTLVKKAVVGKGHASKAQVLRMIQLILNIEESIKEDTADALAVAICAAHSHQRDISLNIVNQS